ncbi:hypothetical protein AD428_07630 [Achromobacter sp. DMS1]|nr:hypothetical protein AD428_08675 [Achromobacter sp. DMS1]KOF54352.1 hypothetical protein AD428_07630 [Achromobacter sp. DMS1]
MFHIKMFLQLRGELLNVVDVKMVGVGILSCFVAPIVGDARYYSAARAQDAVKLLQKIFRPFDVLQRFEADDHVDTVIRYVDQTIRKKPFRKGDG